MVSLILISHKLYVKSMKMVKMRNIDKIYKIARRIVTHGMNFYLWWKGIAMDSYIASRENQIHLDNELLRGPRKSMYMMMFAYRNLSVRRIQGEFLLIGSKDFRRCINSLVLNSEHTRMCSIVIYMFKFQHLGKHSSVLYYLLKTT